MVVTLIGKDTIYKTNSSSLNFLEKITKNEL